MMSLNKVYKESRFCNDVDDSYPFEGTDLYPWTGHARQFQSGQLCRPRVEEGDFFSRTKNCEFDGRVMTVEILDEGQLFAPRFLI